MRRPATPRRPVAAAGFVSSAAAPVLLIGGWTAAAGRQQGGFDSVERTISDLAGFGADDRWLMTAALAGLGLCHVTTAAALRDAATAGRVVLAGGGVATVLVAALPLPADGSGSVPHTAVAAVAFLALSVWPSLAARGDTVGPLLRPVPAVAATATLLGCLGWFGLALRADDGVGLAERVTAGLQSLWPLAVTATVALAARRGRREPAGRPTAVDLVGRRTTLVPIRPDHVRELRRILATPEVSARWDDEAASPDWPDDDPSSVRFAIVVDGVVRGMVQYGEEDDPTYRHASIDVFVDPAVHSRGIGRDAVATLAAHLVDDRGHHRIVIDPAADNEPAIRCYAAVGFRPVGLMRRYERDPATGEWHDGLLMDLLAGELVRP